MTSSEKYLKKSLRRLIALPRIIAPFGSTGQFVIQFYTITEDNALAVIGQYLLIIIPVNHMENITIV